MIGRTLRTTRGRSRGAIVAAWALGVGLLLILLGAAPPVLAHRTPGSTTSITWNARTALLEITHRLHVHDAALGVEPFYGEGPLHVAEPEDQARIALYVEERFAIRVDGAPLALRTLGAQLEGDYLLVLQEGDRRLDAGRVEIRDDILRDAYPGQVNEVFVSRGPGTTVRLRFAGDTGWVTLGD